MQIKVTVFFSVPVSISLSTQNVHILVFVSKVFILYI